MAEPPGAIQMYGETMIDENLSEADKAILRQILGMEVYAKIEKLQGITVTYTKKE